MATPTASPTCSQVVHVYTEGRLGSLAGLGLAPLVADFEGLALSVPWPPAFQPSCNSPRGTVRMRMHDRIAQGGRAARDEKEDLSSRIEHSEKTTGG